MYHATVYRLMIAAPSDIKEEITTAFDVINHWNDMHSEQSKLVLLPLHWSVSSYPAMGKHPQKLLNEQIVEKSDLLICVFGTRLGSPTDTEISGTVEEINEHRRAGKDVMLFFKRNVSDINDVDLAQLQQLNDFKEGIKKDVLWHEFSNTTEFEKKLSDALQLYVNEYWSGNNSNESANVSSARVKFSDNEQDILKKWIHNNDMEYHTEKLTYGTLHYFGNYHQIANNGSEQAKMDDFVDRLKNAGFIEECAKDRVGNPIYKLKKAAYDYVDELFDMKEL